MDLFYSFNVGPDGVEVHWEWPEELGQGYMDLIKIRPGLILGIAKYRLNQDIMISFEHAHPFIDLGFSLSGLFIIIGYEPITV
ncbi:MAG: hypothetical protein V6Z89_10995 [Desulfobacter sp.]